MLNYHVKGRNDITDIRQCFFENRGIKDVDQYINLTDDVLIPYDKLDNIKEAVDLFTHHICSGSQIAIVVDCDVDGYASAAMMYNYIKFIKEDMDVKYLLHTSKAHGLSDDIVIPDNTKLVIIPDGGTNDVEQCKALSEKNINVLILDHHISDIDNPYAVIVNNQMSENYPNKELCGAGVVYKFLQAVDEEMWFEFADEFIELVALANIADLMDIRSPETRRLIDKGLQRIYNECFKTFTRQLAHINGHEIAFKVAPPINAMCRCGKQEEKDILFRAFIETDEKFEYVKRGATKITYESIYDRAVRLCTNAKSRQDRTVNHNLPIFKEEIENKGKNKEPIIFHRVDDDVSGSFTGLYAMKLADYYNRPCLVLRKDGDIYRGSARSYDNCPVDSLKQLLTDIALFDFCRGHDNAFGFAIKPNNVKQAISACQNILKDVDLSKMSVDFEIDCDDLDIRLIQEIDNLQDYYGEGLKEPMVAVLNIPLHRNQGVIMGRDNSTWKFISDDNIAFIRFKNSTDDMVLNFINDEREDCIIINAICRLGFNEYQGVKTPQAQILEYEVIDE